MKLNDVKIGDAIRCSARFGTIESIHIVVRTTATQAVCEGGARFLLKSGLLVGSGDMWSPIYGAVADEEDIARIRMARRIRAAETGLSSLNVTPKNIDAVEALLNEPKP